MTSKRGKRGDSRRTTAGITACVCDQLLDIRTATWNLFVLHNNETPKNMLMAIRLSIKSMNQSKSEE